MKSKSKYTVTGTKQSYLSGNKALHIAFVNSRIKTVRIYDAKI